ncbi:hypothetical protein BC835DRAFT_1289821 [Cytidiella melzeri]|nr:hypothetical protein BC835DRAFT_1289821 [Cytidiella melzeri]
MSVRPFSPTERWSFPMPPEMQNTPHSPTSEDPFSDFTSSSEDHTTTTTTTTTEESFITASTAATIERVHRSFTPTLPDELEVRPGDSVRVLKQFDDGWAYALNVGTGQRGLFPVDCLRSAEVDLSTFLAAKRLSSYAGLVTPLEPVMLHR